MIDKAITYLFETNYRQTNARLFKNLLYVFILLKCFFWILNFDILFGEHAFSLVHNAQQNAFKQFAFLLYYANTPVYSALCIASLILISSVSLIISNPILDFINYIIIININAKIYTFLTAGDPLLANLCFLSIFLRKKEANNTTFFGNLATVLHNFSYAALVLQVIIVYAYSALAKWVDIDWKTGEAIHLVNMTHHYSRAFLINHASVLYPLSFILNYLILAYQTFFPIILCIKRIKKPFLILGICMHLYISIVMGLFFFGLIMTITYVLFYDFTNPKIKK